MPTYQILTIRVSRIVESATVTIEAEDEEAAFDLLDAWEASLDWQLDNQEMISYEYCPEELP